MLVEIIDDSHLHAGHAGAVMVADIINSRLVSAHFIGKSAVERPNGYSALGEMVKRGIHAINIKAYTPEEY